MAILDDLKWRYATKKYDSTKKVSEEDLHKILEAIRLSPTSSGLQQYRVLVITNQELKEKIVPVAYGQKIVADCSHLLVFAAWDKYSSERIDNQYSLISSERNLPENHFAAYTERLKSNYLNQSEEANFVHTAKQAYIGLGFALAQAAELKIDSTPMEGFVNEQLDELLDLKKLGLKSVLLLTLGYRDAQNDWLVNMKKVRVKEDEFIVEIK